MAVHVPQLSPPRSRAAEPLDEASHLLFGSPTNFASPPSDAIPTPSGLVSKIIRRGNGKVRPGPHDRVKIHRIEWTAKGEETENSLGRGPDSFAVNNSVVGLSQGLQLMVVGEQRRFWIPRKLSSKHYHGWGEPPGGLVRDVELIAIDRAPTVATPPDVAAPPRTALTTPSGLAYRVLRAGTGTHHPSPTSRVDVHYTGWTTDGKMFDSSVTRGQTSTFSLSGVNTGWNEGLQLMVEGEKTRFWIPAALAYGKKNRRPGVPTGMLVFDIELLRIH